MELRYGILSTSSIAPRFIAAVRAAKTGQILALSSRSLEKAKEKAALWEIPIAYGNHTALLEDPQINIVYISTVNSQHYPWAKAALAADSFLSRSAVWPGTRISPASFTRLREIRWRIHFVA